jgi:CHRD domain
LLVAIRSGVAYVNVHTTNHPGGEIRGQIHTGENEDE